MAPFFLFTTVLLIGVHSVYTECTGTDCSSRIRCSSSCSCLGFFVDCSRRGLIDVPMDVPSWVQNLDLQNNDISYVDEHIFIGLQNLTELNLSNNQLRTVNSTTFQHLNSLQKLILNDNHLVELPYLGNQTSLNFLSVRHNEIHSLNSSILENLPNLQDLELSFNNLVDLSANTFGNSSSLMHLSLNHNRIVNVEKGIFDNLTSLQSLKMNRNKLSAIPKELFRYLNTLQHLELNYNFLTQIEGLSFQGLSSLVVLKLRNSGIRYLQDGAFYGLNVIKKLQLDFNNISKVTKGWLYGLNSLQRLYLNNNNISEIEDDAWDSSRRIIELDMSYNKLQMISSKAFDKLYSLKRLILSDNMITYIEEDAFNSLSALQYLELSNNEVSWTIEDTGKIFSGLYKLKYLGLSNNKIKSVVKRAFTGLSRLETLNITHNEVSTIEENAFDEMPHLQDLYLNTTSLLCDCKLLWMSMRFHYSIHAACGFPERLRGTSIFEVSPSEMLCESSPKPVILRDPRTKVTLKGENVALDCQSSSSGTSDVKIHWRKNRKLLHNIRHQVKNSSSREGNFTLYTSTLQMNNIQDEDEGYYQCVVSNHFGSVYSHKAQITVHVFPVFTKTPVDIAIKTGSTARLECGAIGQPHPRIEWQKDGGDFPAARERRMHVMPTDDVFFIVGVKPSDTGVYSCTAENKAGIIIANATLTVLETPSFVKKMEDKETRAGETAVLECLASGSPKPKLTWTKDGGPLHATERHFFTAGNQLLIIVHSQVSDSGVYTCEMSNTLGTERGSSHLKISPAVQSGPSADEGNTTTGVIVIAVVVCVVGTSIIWVIIIYHTRKRAEEYAQAAANSSPQASEIAPYHMYPKELKQSDRHTYLDSHSGHSKDSGTGDSGQPSNDDLLIEDEQGLLLHNHSPSKFGGISMMGSFIGLQDRANGNQVVGEQYSSGNVYVPKEQMPLLHTFRTKQKTCCRHHQPPTDDHNSHLNPNDATHCKVKQWLPNVSRSFSAEHISCREVQCPCNKASDEAAVCVDLDATCGSSTFPRSLTLGSVNNWSGETPRFHKLPKDIPNDSGSFSIADEEAQQLPCEKVRSTPAFPLPTKLSSKKCTGVYSSTKSET